ncbi:MAG: radical SAM protein, partial [Humidesulfovibrio sp.]|nr:radical SAM protein [Humidesulfovibrio sp.]
MHILFLEPNLSIEGDPMGVMQLSAMAHTRGHTTDIVQLEDDYVDAIRKAAPGLLAVSMMSTEYVRMRSAIAKIRAALPELKILAGGPHPTFVPSCIDDLAVDGICVGEGDYAFLDVLERCEAGRDWDGIPNIHTRTSKNPPRPLVEDLDTLPFPDREIVYRNSPAVGSFRLRSFLSTRGCPFMCTYCFNHAYNAMYKGLGRVVRKRSVDNLLAEVEMVVRTYPTDFLKFADDSFVLGVDDWLREFSVKYRQRVGLPFYCLVRADVVTPEMVRLLKEAGCVSVCMSIETGNETIRREVLHRNVTNERIIQAFDLFNAADIRIYTNNMLG